MSADFSRTLHRLRRGTTAGLHLGAQITVIQGGRIVLDEALGANAPDQPLSNRQLMPWLSAGKPITAAAVLQLWERGRIDLDTPLVEWIPEFGQNGKDRVSIRHLLTHTGAFRDGDRVSEHLDWQAAVARVCAATVDADAVPGQTAAYHVSGSWIMLGELIRRVDGRMPDRYVREEVCQPAGLSDTWMSGSMPNPDGEKPAIGWLYFTNGGSFELHPYLNRDPSLAHPRPGSSMRGPVRDLAQFYETLRTGGGRILRPETVRQMTSRQRAGQFDQTFQQVIDWGWGLIINSDHYRKGPVPYGFGAHAGPDTFGHGGMQCACGFADPHHELVVAWVCNGMPGEKLHQLRAREINSAIYEDLGLVR